MLGLACLAVSGFVSLLEACSHAGTKVPSLIMLLNMLAYNQAPLEFTAPPPFVPS